MDSFLNNGYNPERDRRRNSQDKCLPAERHLPLHITVCVVVVKNLYDQLVVIAVHCPLGAPAKHPAAIDGDLPVLPVPGLFHVKCSGPDEINMLDELLERAGFVQLELNDLRNRAVVPALQGRVALIQHGP